MKILIIPLMCLNIIFYTSCKGQNDNENSNNFFKKREKEEYFYANKYFPILLKFRKLLCEEYFDKVDFQQLKLIGRCAESNPLLFPVSFNTKIDTILSQNFTFSEDILFVSVVYIRKKMPEMTIWCSNMQNYCNAEQDFIQNNITNIEKGDLQIQNGFGIGIFKDIQQNNDIIYLGSDSLLNDFPITVKIYLRKKNR